MKRVCFLILALICADPLVAADWRAVQQALKEKECYFGRVDGTAGPETRAAIRRFQIRAGLPVTGEPDDATLKALAGFTTWSEPMVASDSAPGAPLDLDEIFSGTALGGESVGKRRHGVREAQRKLKSAGIYKGGVDGRPGKGTHAAIMDFQARNGLASSGALDSATLAALGLDEAALAAYDPPRRSAGSRRGDNVVEKTGRTLGKFFRKVF